jgi:hypothetical protein
MSHDTTTEMLFKVHDYNPDTTVITQYGMRYPDGSVKWGQDGSTLNPLYFKSIHDGHASQTRIWKEALAKRATDANVELEAYTAGHTIIKRTVIVAITGSEDVGPSVLPKENPWGAPPVPAPPFEL